VNLSSVFSDIKQLLSISNENFDLENYFNQYCISEPEENKLEIASGILNFVNKFSLFQDNKPFMNSLYTCITNSLENKARNVCDYEDFLIKNSVMHFVQEYIKYSKITQKDQVLQFITNSLEKLENQAIITNLGLLIKPLYQDQTYLSNITSIDEVEVKYNSTDIDVKVKSEIDKWLKDQDIDIDGQDLLKKRMLFLLDRLFSKYDIEKNSEKSEELQTEVMEMLNMRLTMLSLMDEFQDESFEPISIK
jgi:hypothetical protein